MGREAEDRHPVGSKVFHAHGNKEDILLDRHCTVLTSFRFLSHTCPTNANSPQPPSILMAANDTTKLSTLTEWSVQHIKDIFEGGTDEDSLRSISETFADDISATVNGTPLSRQGIDVLVLTMRKGSQTGLKVHWKHLVEAPRDANTNRVSLISCSV
jgi:hypothetical protein